MNGLCTADVIKQFDSDCHQGALQGEILMVFGRSNIPDCPDDCLVPQPRNVLGGGSSFPFLYLSWDKIAISASLYPANNSFMHPSPFVLLGECKLSSQKSLLCNGVTTCQSLDQRKLHR